MRPPPARRAEATFAEVQEYASRLPTKKRLSLDIVLLALSRNSTESPFYAAFCKAMNSVLVTAVLLAVASLPVRVVERTIYQKSIREAKRRIGRRDPDDVDVLALALHAGVPVWSNDNDFEDAGVEWFTTAALLAKWN